MSRLGLAAFLLFVLQQASAVCSVETFKARTIVGVACFETAGRCVPISNASVELLTPKGKVLSSARVTEGGEFRIQVSGGSKLRMRVAAPGFVAIECVILSKGAAHSETFLTAVLGSDAILDCGGGRVIQGPWKASPSQ